MNPSGEQNPAYVLLSPTQKQKLKRLLGHNPLGQRENVPDNRRLPDKLFKSDLRFLLFSATEIYRRL
jgi:hypothetical protein